MSRVDVRIESRHNTALAHKLDADDGARGTVLPEEVALRRGEHDPWAGIPEAGSPLPRVVIGDLDDEVGRPALMPIIGPRLRHAREALGLSVAEVSRRTKIREHLLESIEVDDFEPCGGDFYARGHLRSLAGVLGLDAESLVATYDDRYATGPIAARTVFEAELAHNLTGGRFAGLRGAGGLGGPRWSLMLAVVLVLALAWGVARMLSPEPTTISDPTSQLGGSAAVTRKAPITSDYGAPVTMSVRAMEPATGTATVLVRDHSGKILWSGTLRQGQRKQLFGTGPFTVQSSDGTGVDVWVDGHSLGPVGPDHDAARGTFR